MSAVRIEIDGRGSTFTCLDYITGRVIMNISTEETISSITVKMEGISRTRLLPPRNDPDGRDSKRAEVEIHRLLYLVETVFPSSPIRENTSASHTGYTLKPGQYEYPFRIRIPLNSTCGEDPSGAHVGGLLQKLSFEKGNLDYAKNATRHVRATLPPSLSGIPGDEAWVRYFLKVTVNRPQFYRLNMRAYDPFVFLPIEPPRPAPSTRETFAKRQHQMIYTPSPSRKRGGLFAAFRHAPEPIENITHHVHFSIEVRLPAPPIIVPNSPLPLRIILVKHQPYKHTVIIRSLHIVLHAFTEITAHEIRKTDRTAIPVLNLGGLRTPLGVDGTPVGVEVEADMNLWAGASLPDTVPPSFKTCNIWRTYQLEVVLGLSHGFNEATEMIPLTMPVQVYSGIAPPQKLLDSTFPPAPPPRKTSTGKSSNSLTVPTHPFSGSLSEKNSPVSSPVTMEFPKRPHSFSSGAPWSSNAPPASRPHSSAGHGGGSVGGSSGESSGGGGGGGARAEDLPPPTYEDALADDIGPVDGPRRRYEQEGGYYGALPEDVY